MKSKANDLLYNPGDDVEIVHFHADESCVIHGLQRGRPRRRTILVGREGAVGGIVSQGYLPAYTRIVVKFGGPFGAPACRKLDRRNKVGTLRNVLPLCRCMLAQIFQSTAASHPFDRAAHREMDHSAMELPTVKKPCRDA